jgi:hypothetical protein
MDNETELVAHMTRISLDHTFTVSKDAVFRDLDGEAVILDLQSGTYFGLNAVGARIWHLMVHHGTLRIVLEELCREYDSEPAVLEQDLLTLVSQLTEVRLGAVQ